MEGVPRKVPAREIEVRWPEEGNLRGDDGAGARAPLGSGRSEEEERNDKWVPHPIQINIWAMPGGLSAVPSRTVREAGVTATTSYCMSKSLATKA